MVGSKTIVVLALFSVAMGIIPIQPIKNVETVKFVEKFDAAEENLGFSLCPTCVSLFGQVWNQLINIILNAGVIGGCDDVCGKLDNQLEQVACTLLCSYAGVNVFIDLIQKIDFDSIYLCELMHVCPVTPGGAGKVDNVSVNPAVGPRGTVFEIEMMFEIFNATSTGEIVIEVDPPLESMDMPIEQGFVNTGFQPGKQGIKITLDSSQSSQDFQFSHGTYNVTMALCEGSCGSDYPHAQILGEGRSSFQIKGQGP